MHWIVDFVNWNHFPSIISIIAALIAAWVAIRTNKMNKKNQLAFENRKLKQDMYYAYLDAIGDYGNIAKNQTVEDKERNTNKWVDAHNRLMLIGNAESIKAILSFEECAKKSENEQNSGEYEKKLDSLLKAFRADLYEDESVNDGVPTLSLLTAVAKNHR